MTLEAPEIANILTKPISDVIALVENQEKAHNDPHHLPYRLDLRNKSKPAHRGATPAAVLSLTDQVREATCPYCATAFKILTQRARGWNIRCALIDTVAVARKSEFRTYLRPTANVRSIESDLIAQISSLQVNNAQSISHC